MPKYIHSRMQKRIFAYWLYCVVIVCQFSCSSQKSSQTAMNFTEQQLTSGQSGHTINPSEIFSPDDQWIVFDSRNEDTGIKSTGSIAMVNTKTGETKLLYQTKNQTEYGPGVGAATFCPVANRVLFLHGIRNADKDHPYDMTRRTGIAIDTDKPNQPIFVDARNIIAPFTPGALRGGTHAHSWSGDGQWISCTYNDFILQQLSRTDSAIKDLRVVAVMAPLKAVVVPANAMENNNGEFFSAVVTRVTAFPKPGSDEIEKAFDETWIGKNGYKKQNGEWQKRAIAFQGNVRDENNTIKTEVFIVDIPDDITRAAPNEYLQGTDNTMPSPPMGTVQRRITYTQEGIQGPRHWLRSTWDGKTIAFLAKDNKGIIQIFGVSPNGGAIEQFTFNDFPVQSTFNFSPDDNYLSYIADNSIFIHDIAAKKSTRITKRFPDGEGPVNGVVWSHDGNRLAYNRYVTSGGKKFLQVFLLIKK